MGSVADLATYAAGHYKDAITLSIEHRPEQPTLPGGEDSLPRLAHLRHNPPAHGQHRHPIGQIGRIQ